MMKEKGYTLIECLVTIGLVVILAALSMRGFVAAHDRMHEQIVADEWRHRITFARLMALNIGKPVTLCASTNGITCGGEWHEGQIIIADKEQEALLLAVFPPLPPKETLTFHAFPLSEHLTFQPWGVLKGQNGTLTWRQRKKWGKVIEVIVSKSGRVRISH